MPKAKLQSILDALRLRKVEYADARFVHVKNRRLTAKNGAAASLEDRETSGIGIRVLSGGAWGFAATPDLSKKALEAAARRAFDTARASARLRQRRIVFGRRPPLRAYWRTAVQIDPWSVDPQEQMNILAGCTEILRRDRRIFESNALMNFTRREQIFASTEGRWIESLRYLTGSEMSCRAGRNGASQKRSYPSPSHDYRAQGYEAIIDLRLRDNADRVREEALMLLKARPCPARRFDLILRNSILALQIHETVGHASELDRVFGYEDNFGGRTFLRPGDRGRLRVASPEVSIIANRRAEKDGAGYIEYDDEGTETLETPVLERGLFKNYLSSRETAQFLRLRRPSGSMIAKDWSCLPLIRMTSLSLLPGERPYDELLAGVRDGLLVDSESSWSIDEQRSRFQIGGEIAWHVKNGKIRGIYRNPLFRGESTRFWHGCYAVADEKDWSLSGFSDCGKGGPYQQVFVSHGSSPAFFKGVECYASGK